MRLVQNKEPLALERLYDRHAPMVLGFLFNILDERSMAEAALQETFFRIWCDAARFRVDQSRFQTWVYTIAYYVAFDVKREL